MENTGNAPNNPPKSEPLLLPGPSRLDTNTPQIQLGTDAKLTFDHLGPMVVNSDGTLSRIANWAELTEAERKNTLRVLGARNRLRMSNEEKRLAEAQTGLSLNNTSLENGQ